jgi:hypothetical protein
MTSLIVNVRAQLIFGWKGTEQYYSITIQLRPLFFASYKR